MTDDPESPEREHASQLQTSHAAFARIATVSQHLRVVHGVTWRSTPLPPDQRDAFIEEIVATFLARFAAQTT